MAGGSEMIVNDALCRARVKAHEQRLEKIEDKLDKHEDTMGGIAECLAKLTALYEVTTTELAEARTQIHTLETKPINRWEKILTGVISGGGGAALGALLMQLFNG